MLCTNREPLVCRQVNASAPALHLPLWWIYNTKLPVYTLGHCEAVIWFTTGLCEKKGNLGRAYMFAESDYNGNPCRSLNGCRIAAEKAEDCGRIQSKMMRSHLDHVLQISHFIHHISLLWRNFVQSHSSLIICVAFITEITFYILQLYSLNKVCHALHFTGCCTIHLTILFLDFKRWRSNQNNF